MKFRYLELFYRNFQKFSILAYISLKIGYFKLSQDYNVTVKSYMECWYLSWYVWKEEVPILWYLLHVSGRFHFQVHRGVTTHLGKSCYKTGLVGRGLISL